MLEIYSDLTTEHDDSVEILSCQLEAGDSIYYKMGSGPTATCKEVVKRFAKREPTKKQRIIARIVMVVFMTMLTMSVLLVIVSLTMSEHIDDLARKITTNKIRTGLSKPSPTKNFTSFKQTFARDTNSVTDSTFYTDIVTEGIMINSTNI